MLTRRRTICRVEVQFCALGLLLDKWLRESALTADRAGTARTFVWIEGNNVVAYFSLARLALDSRLHGRGLGQQLLVDALWRAVAAVVAAGGRLLVVDAIDQRAASFYEHHGFRRLAAMTLRA